VNTVPDINIQAQSNVWGKAGAYSRVEHLKGASHNIFIRLAPVLLLINSVVSTVKRKLDTNFYHYNSLYFCPPFICQCYKNTTVNYSGIFNPTFSRVKMTLKNDFGLKKYYCHFRLNYAL
jgi:hypothetical protein